MNGKASRTTRPGPSVIDGSNVCPPRHPAPLSQFGIQPALAALLDPVGEPCLHLGFNPSDGADADLHSAWESLLGLKLIDHRSTKTSDFAYLRQT